MGAKKDEGTADLAFIDALERGIRDVLKNRKTTPSEKVQAINAGAKLLAVRYKIQGGEEESFFGRKP